MGGLGSKLECVCPEGGGKNQTRTSCYKTCLKTVRVELLLCRWHRSASVLRDLLSHGGSPKKDVHVHISLCMSSGPHALLKHCLPLLASVLLTADETSLFLPDGLSLLQQSGRRCPHQCTSAATPFLCMHAIWIPAHKLSVHLQY